MVPHKLRLGVTISTLLGENINIDDIYRRVKLYIGGLQLNGKLQYYLQRRRMVPFDYALIFR